MPRLEMGRLFLVVDKHTLPQGGDRGGRGATHGECGRRSVRRTRLPRLCSFRFSRRHGWCDQVARSQSELQLVLGWEDGDHGGNRRHELSSYVAGDPRLRVETNTVIGGCQSDASAIAYENAGWGADPPTLIE